MSAAGAETQATEPDERPSPPHDAHPTPRDYVRIGVWLFIATGLEVSLIYVEVGRLFVPTLVVLMTLKFALVVAWYMHLKFDSRVFARLFFAGAAIAIGIYLAALAMSGVFAS